MPDPTPDPTPTPSPTPEPPTKPTTTYSHRQLGISFSYPAEWSIDDSNPTLVRLRPLAPEGTIAVGVQSNLTGPTSLDSQRDQLLRSLAGATLNVYRVTHEDDVPHDVIEAQWTAGDSHRKAAFVVAVRGARVHSIGAIGLADVYDEHQADFMRMIESFRTAAALEPASIDGTGDLDQILDDIGGRASGIRGIQPPEGFGRSLQSRDEFKASSELVDGTPQDLALLKDLCLVLDLCDETHDLEQTIKDLTGLGVLGYYRPEDKSVTLVTDEDGVDPLAWLTYAHEYTHALQDRRFDLSSLEPVDSSFEASKGLAALVEGDAKLVENLFYETLPKEQQIMVEEALDRAIEEFAGSAVGAPRIITETFGWEHVAGAQLVFRLYLSGDFEVVNQSFENPPRSTEQVLHPEKYLTGEPPLNVDLPDLAPVLGTGWIERDTGVLGELRTKVYLDTFLSTDQSEEAAAGWGGDRYALFKDGEDRLLMVVRILWDRPLDADQFSVAYQGLAAVKGQGEWQASQPEEGAILWVGDGTSVHLSQVGSETLLVIGPDQEPVSAVAEAVSAFASAGG